MDLIARTMYEFWYIWLPAIFLVLTHALAYRKGYKKGKGDNVSLAFYDAVMDAIRGANGQIEFRKLVESVDARSTEWNASETEATLLAMRDQGIITIAEDESDVKFQGKSVSTNLMVALATT